MNVVVFPVFAIIDRKKSFHFSLPYLIAFLSTLNFLRGVTESINSSRLNQTSSVSLLPISIQITIFISFYSVLCEFLSIRMTSLRHYRSFLILFQMIKWTITANTVSLFADVAGVYVLVAQICIEFLTFMVRNFRYKKLFLWVKTRVNMNRGTTQDSDENKVTFVSCLDYELLAQEYIVQMFARFTIILRVTADTSIGSELVRPKLLCKAGYQFYFYHLAYEAISIFIMSLSFWIVTKKLYPTLKLRIGVGKVLKKIDVVMVLVFVVSFAYVLEGSFQLRCF
ncbi:hypothetical protein BKA69DRAFT_506828 [Paraphysoderma sedebokerense]|nr:hypothetical protein BKA69DRAFT_506828 [Paraphysoderma sedebokerense]